ncbi:unnamed protein product [Lampetra fluviatilis]
MTLDARFTNTHERASELGRRHNHSSSSSDDSPLRHTPAAAVICTRRPTSSSSSFLDVESQLLLDIVSSSRAQGKSMTFTAVTPQLPFDSTRRQSCRNALAALVAATWLLAGAYELQTIEQLDTSSPDVQLAIVRLHNELRANVTPLPTNMLKMEWNSIAGNNSLAWAKRCILNHSPANNRKTPGFQCGENIFLATGPLSWQDAVLDWYNEADEPGFIFGKGAAAPGDIGHYTQVVWYSSFQLGCGVSYCPEAIYKYVYVCHYCPAGNLNTRLSRPYDEGSPCGSCPNDCEDDLCTNACPYRNLYANCDPMKKIYGCAPTGNGKIIRSYCPASCFCSDKIY